MVRCRAQGDFSQVLQIRPHPVRDVCIAFAKVVTGIASSMIGIIIAGITVVLGG